MHEKNANNLLSSCLSSQEIILEMLVDTDESITLAEGKINYTDSQDDSIGPVSYNLESGI